MSDRIETIQSMIADDPADAFLRFSLGMEYAGRERWQAAADAFEACTRLDATYLAGYVERGKCLRAKGDLAGARDVFAEAMEVAVDQGERHVQDYIRQQINALPPKQ